MDTSKLPLSTGGDQRDAVGGTLRRHRKASVTVVYTAPGGTRQTRTFPNMAAARKFYVTQAAAGGNPTITQAITTA